MDFVRVGNFNPLNGPLNGHSPSYNYEHMSERECAEERNPGGKTCVIEIGKLKLDGALDRTKWKREIHIIRFRLPHRPTTRKTRRRRRRTSPLATYLTRSCLGPSCSPLSGKAYYLPRRHQLALHISTSRKYANKQMKHDITFMNFKLALNPRH